MWRLLLTVCLLPLPFLATAEPGVFDIQPIELTRTGDSEYRFRFVQVSQPFGYGHKADRELVLHLRFKCPVYECPEGGRFPTAGDFNAAIELLKEQMAAAEQIRFAIAGRGYARIKGTENEYQSNALYVDNGVVCSDYDFFDF